ncbi:unnamed protein product [Soboliphyme baturini]|uniref:Large ribosomal subunit protein uL3m n=1 Tax=Soboliphyme baturini TaxID=241478 RepID=A0A183I909_9BILA|nr:unnamed protein product [Soboliphyme baturini]
MKYVDPETFYKFSSVGKKEGRGKLGRIIIGVNPDNPQKYTAAYRGLFEEAGIMPAEKIVSFAVTPNSALAPGTRLYAQHFKVGQYVDLWGKTIDYGFQGVMRRWNFKGMPATHGVTKSHRRTGSIGTTVSKPQLFASLFLRVNALNGLCLRYALCRVSVKRVNYSSVISKICPDSATYKLKLSNLARSGTRLLYPTFFFLVIFDRIDDVDKCRVTNQTPSLGNRCCEATRQIFKYNRI